MSKKNKRYENILATDEDRKMFEETAKMIKAVRDGDEPCPICEMNKSKDELTGYTVFRSPCIMCGR